MDEPYFCSWSSLIEVDPVMQFDQDRSRSSIIFDQDPRSWMDQAISINFDQSRLTKNVYSVGLPVAMVIHGLHGNRISPTLYFSNNLAVLIPESCIFEHKKGVIPIILVTYYCFTTIFIQ